MVEPAIRADPSAGKSANAASVIPDSECFRTRSSDERSDWRRRRVAKRDWPKSIAPVRLRLTLLLVHLLVDVAADATLVPLLILKKCLELRARF